MTNHSSIKPLIPSCVYLVKKGSLSKKGLKIGRSTVGTPNQLDIILLMSRHENVNGFPIRDDHSKMDFTFFMDRRRIILYSSIGLQYKAAKFSSAATSSAGDNGALNC